MYLAGVNDGENDCGFDDIVNSYFGDTLLAKDSKEVMPNDDVWDLWKQWELKD